MPLLYSLNFHSDRSSLFFLDSSQPLSLNETYIKHNNHTTIVMTNKCQVPVGIRIRAEDVVKCNQGVNVIFLKLLTDLVNSVVQYAKMQFFVIVLRWG